MTLVAQLETSSLPQGETIGDSLSTLSPKGESEGAFSQFTVGAFCGEECRGVGRWVGDKLFITVHGTIGQDETITFRAYEPTTGEVMTVDETVTFNGQCLGSLGSPMALHVGGTATIISGQWHEDGTARVYSSSGRLLNQPRQGVNIIVRPNGTVKKELRTK